MTERKIFFPPLGWSELELRLSSGQLKLELGLGLSLAIFWYSSGLGIGISSGKMVDPYIGCLRSPMSDFCEKCESKL